MPADVIQQGPQMDTPGIGRRPGVFAWLLLAPLLVWLVVFVIGPTLIMAVYSFGQADSLGQVQFVRNDAAGASQPLWTPANYARVVDRNQLEAITVCIVIGAVFGAVAWGVVRQTSLRFRFGESTVLIAGVVSLIVGWILLTAYTAGWEIGPISFTRIFTFTAEKEPPPWLKSFVLSINYAVISTSICVIAGYPVAYFIGKAPERWRNMLLMLVMVPFWTSFLVRTYAWITILGNQGVLNTTLLKLGLITDPIDMYPSQMAVMLGLVYTYLPFMILPIYTSVERLDNAYVEAAFDLGASPLRAFNNVIFPLTRPGVIAGVLLVFVPAVGMFAVNELLGGRQEMLIGNVIQEQFGRAKNPPFGAALGILLLVLFILTYYFMTKRADPARK